MVKWGPETDAILLAGIVEYAGVTMSQGLLKHLADKIGDGCTPKAVTHRLANIKKAAKDSASGSTTSAPGTPKKNAATKGPKTPATGKRGRATPKSAKGGLLSTYGDTNGYSFNGDSNEMDGQDDYDDEIEQLLTAKKVKLEQVKTEPKDEDSEDEDSENELQASYV